MSYFCPTCGKSALKAVSNKQFVCDACQFTFFQNVASAVMVALCYQDEVLVATRAREPGLGMWDLPGGFVDPDESMEEAVVRELHEELDIRISGAQYVFSNSNTYVYKNVEYKTCDAFFVAELDEKPVMKAQDDVASIEWIKLADLDPEKFAFGSAKKAVNELKRRKL